MRISHEYDDIIELPHHQSATHPQMSLHDRAAQFAPFAALTGYEEVCCNRPEKPMRNFMHGFMETVCSRKIWCWKKNSREEKRQKGIEIPENRY